MSKKKSDMIQQSGARKRSVARATLYPGSGIVRINRQRLETVQPALARERIMEPLVLAGDAAKTINIDVNLHGGGVMSGADAVRLAIARALVAHNKGLREPFLDYDRNLLVADVRFKEACKPNDSKARAARQKSYR